MNKVTFFISFHEGDGKHVGAYETLEDLNKALRKIGKTVSLGYCKTDVHLRINGVDVWKAQIEPDYHGNDTDLMEKFRMSYTWFSVNPHVRLILPEEECVQNAAMYQWLMLTLKLFCNAE